MDKKTLLVIGDEKISRNRPYVSFLRFVKHAHRLKDKEKSFDLKVIGYSQLLSGKLPKIEAPSIKVVFFFPYKYWNRHIEIYPDERIYGDKKFGQEFKAFFKKAKKAIEGYYQGKSIEYLNSPNACYLDRDKKASKDLLRKNKVPTPRPQRASSFADIQRLLNKRAGLYIKPRFGSMGKGITYVDKQGVTSNFLFRQGRLKSRPSDFNWRFTRIKDEEIFLNKLLERGFICEEAIQPAIFRKRRFDFRIYVMFGKVVYLYAKSSPAQYCVTNWSQGGRLDKKQRILRTLTKEKVTILEQIAREATRALGLNFAGVDIIFSQDLKDAYVIEANAFPGYEKGFDLMKCLLTSLVK